MVYPAGYGIAGVASTDNFMNRSDFSDYDDKIVDVAAPGEGIITLYPGDNYAAGWGTSFSAPFVSGVSAMVVDLLKNANQSTAQQALSQAVPLGKGLGAGELNALWASLYAQFQIARP
jgi:thermitase